MADSQIYQQNFVAFVVLAMPLQYVPLMVIGSTRKDQVLKTCVYCMTKL